MKTCKILLAMISVLALLLTISVAVLADTAIHVGSEESAETSAFDESEDWDVSSESEEEYSEEPEICGDVNWDGNVDMKDVLTLRKYLAGLEVDSFNSELSDVNADRAIDMKDVLLIRKFLAQMVPELPVITKVEPELPADPTNAFAHKKVYLCDENGEILYLQAYHVVDENDLDLIVTEYDENGYLLSTEVYERNAAGQEVCVTYYDGPQKELFSKTETTYDKDGNTLTEITTFAGDEPFVEKTEYVYDENGNLLKEIQSDSYSEPWVVEEYNYDANGNLLTRKKFNSDGTLYELEEDEYNENGDISRSVTTNYEEDGETISTVVDAKYENYDEYGQIGKYTFHEYSDGEWFDSVEEYFYDMDEETGKPKSVSIRVDGGDIVKAYSMVYNEFGDVTELTYYGEDGEIFGQIISEYDENGNETCFKMIMGGVVQGETTYTYDEKGRLTEVLDLFNLFGIPEYTKTIYEYLSDILVP